MVYQKIILKFTFYEDMMPKTYGTHYCLENNAKTWEIIDGPDYGSYAFSVPPFPDCSYETPASFIFALTQDNYNELKQKGTNKISVYAKVGYEDENKKINNKNIEFIMYVK